jgi:hypothetical protein
MDGPHPASKANLESLSRHFAAVLLQFARLGLPSKDLPDSLHFAEEVLIGKRPQSGTRLRAAVGEADLRHRISPTTEVILKRPNGVTTA